MTIYLVYDNKFGAVHNAYDTRKLAETSARNMRAIDDGRHNWIVLELEVRTQAMESARKRELASAKFYEVKLK